MDCTSGLVTPAASITRCDWQDAWRRLPNGALTHESTLTYDVLIQIPLVTKMRVDLCSLEAWQTVELRNGLPILSLAPLVRSN